ncbi:hypothetical protein OK074_2059 [Actinobacteria bacterium OK074]|nr:hypothetical protein OK074_2059 [Actinobacteria bacterium OK074]
MKEYGITVRGVAEPADALADHARRVEGPSVVIDDGG